MKYEIIVKNGQIVDPSRKMDSIGDIYVAADRIVEPGESKGPGEAGLVIDAEGCIVVPGLVDFHSHVFYGGTELGYPPDLGAIPNGVTTVVDAGSAGSGNYEAFHNSVITNSLVRIKAFINVSPVGQTTSRYDECVDPRYYDSSKIKSLFEKYPGELIGLKLRLGKKVVGDLGIKPLEETIRLANEIGCPIVVHPTDPPVDTDEIVNLLRKGDIFVHTYHGTGSTILDTSSKVRQSVRDARARGVIFDAGEGRFNISFKTARAAIADSFLPDIISSDCTIFALNKQPVVSMANIVSKYLNLGIELSTAIKACTYTPASVLGMQDSIGTLKPGAYADISIFKLIDSKPLFYDTEGTELEGTKLLVPMATIKSGQLLYRRIDFR